MKPYAPIFIVVFLVSTSFVGVSYNLEKPSILSSNGTTLNVGGSGEGNYSKIQDAVDNASEGDTVFVYDDSSPYYENIIIRKSISLKGENRNSTVIDGKGKGNVISIKCSYVDIQNFTIQNCKNNYGYAGITIHSRSFNTITNNNIRNSSSWPWIFSDGIQIIGGKNNIISGNVISHTWDSISIYSSNNNIISNNTLLNHIHGIYIYSSNQNNIITGNTFLESDNNGILIYMDSNVYTDNLVISNNYMDGNYSPISGGFEAISSNRNCYNISIIGNYINDFGDAIWIKCTDSLIENNRIFNTTFQVIQLREGSYSINISKNIISKGKIGINLEGSNNFVSHNIIKNCDLGLDITGEGKENIIVQNEFNNDKKGIEILLGFNTAKIIKNNFINNKRDISFYQFLPLRRHTYFTPIFENNYYDSSDGNRPHSIFGASVLFAIPIIIPIFPYFGLLPISIPWIYFDWHPAKEPYDIEV
jgi:parallel beta-helix repeat protein